MSTPSKFQQAASAIAQALMRRHQNRKGKPINPPGVLQEAETVDSLRKWMDQALLFKGDETTIHFTTLRDQVDMAFAGVLEEITGEDSARELTEAEERLVGRIEAYASAVSEHNVQLTIGIGLGKLFKWLDELEKGP